MKRTSLVLFATIVIASIFANGPMGYVEAAPVMIPQQEQHQLPLARLPHSSSGRLRIKTKAYSKSHQRKHRPSSHQIQQALNELNQDGLARERVAVISAWYHQRSDFSIHPRRRGLGGDRERLQGHAVLDDEDDDAGNELLDTEDDDDLRTLPDGDDTIEGQILEEEEDDEPSSAEAETEELIRLSRSSIGWLHENGLQDRDVVPEDFEEDDMEEEEEGDEEVLRESNLEFDNGDVVEEDEELEAYIIPTSKFGGNVAAAEMAAGEP
ncbi:hypothetical protein EMPS_07922 [Entomortierella parvispora]|uniref:Uncharacterized protein n=1 Tax=Entomortierella parvispora TaxID=205924 RepID=A0A9P3LYU2_9FUNG|nr:hypothetical protein EMPS_07922 [Entomortierella parvispora]